MAIVKQLGFAGVGFVDMQQVLITSGSMSKEHNVPYVQPLDIPNIEGSAGGPSRTRVQYADGTITLTGSIGFDINAPGMALFTVSRLLRRGYNFPIRMFDGETGYYLRECFITSLSLSGSVGGLVTASLNFVSRHDWQPQPDAATGLFNRPESPIGYWAAGNANVRDWTFNYTQSAEPVYLNQMVVTDVVSFPAEDDRWPRYIRVGVVEYGLDVTTYDGVLAHDTIKIFTSAFTLTGTTGSEGYNFGGPTDLGTFTHTWKAGAPANSGSDAIVISSGAF